MKKTILVFLMLMMLFAFAHAEGADPFQGVDTPIAAGESVTYEGLDFGDGASLLRLIAETDSQLEIRIFVDGNEKPAATLTYRPVNKEFRCNISLQGVHDLAISLEGSGTLLSWRFFADKDTMEAVLKAERGVPYEDSIPSRCNVNCERGGTVEKFTYTAHDSFHDGEAYEKDALVYLPYGYDPAQTYDLLILCHGVGGSEYEWGLMSGDSRVKKIMDNLIDSGDIRPFIIVTPNGRAGRTEDYSSFYAFDTELREDLLPALAERYAVDITDRNRCAMAGLSMGGMQTINLGIGKCLDLFSAFGAFSAAPTSNEAGMIAAVINSRPDLPIRMFYSICGTEDTIAIGSTRAAMNNLPGLTDQLNDKNFAVQYVPGGHDFTVWYLGFYNFAMMIAGN